MMEIFYKVSAPSASTRSPPHRPSLSLSPSLFVCRFFLFLFFIFLSSLWGETKTHQLKLVAFLGSDTHTYTRTATIIELLPFFFNTPKKTQRAEPDVQVLMWERGGSVRRRRGACLMSVWAFCGRWNLFHFNSAPSSMTFFFFCFFFILKTVCRIA